MKIVSTVEFVRVVLLLVDLDLDAVVVEMVLLAEHFVGLHEDALLLTLLLGVQQQMARERVLVVVQRPDMDVVDLLDALDVVEALLDAVDVQVIGDGLEDQDDTLPEGEARGP